MRGFTRYRGPKAFSGTPHAVLCIMYVLLRPVQYLDLGHMTVDYLLIAAYGRSNAKTRPESTSSRSMVALSLPSAVDMNVMSLRKTAAFGSVNICQYCSNCSTPPPWPRRSGNNDPTVLGRRGRRNTYATKAPNPRKPASPEHELAWPVVADDSRIPTPYQIFNQSQNEPYSKRRFYDLVKIYHPDRTRTYESSSTPSQTDFDTHLERYRLVIAANAILSDPAKRSAYDHTGHGWSDSVSDFPAKQSSATKYSTYHRWQTDTITRFGWNIDNDPMYNATWEDWERWYDKQRRQYHTAAYGSSPASRRPAPWTAASFFSAANTPSQGVYASNSMFLSIVALLAALGGIGSATRANNTALTRTDRIQAHSERVSQNLMTARDDATGPEGTDSKGDRIRRWVRDRDEYGEGEMDGRTLRAGQDVGVCSSGVTMDREEKPFWRKPVDPWGKR